jgi:hypothetical protein
MQVLFHRGAASTVAIVLLAPQAGSAGIPSAPSQARDTVGSRTTRWARLVEAAGTSAGQGAAQDRALDPASKLERASISLEIDAGA